MNWIESLRSKRPVITVRTSYFVSFFGCLKCSAFLLSELKSWLSYNQRMCVRWYEVFEIITAVSDKSNLFYFFVQRMWYPSFSHIQLPSQSCTDYFISSSCIISLWQYRNEFPENEGGSVKTTRARCDGRRRSNSQCSMQSDKSRGIWNRIYEIISSCSFIAPEHLIAVQAFPENSLQLSFRIEIKSRKTPVLSQTIGNKESLAYAEVARVGHVGTRQNCYALRIITVKKTRSQKNTWPRLSTHRSFPCELKQRHEEPKAENFIDFCCTLSVS